MAGGRSIIVTGADFSTLRPSIPLSYVPRVKGINAMFCAAKYDYASGNVTNPIADTSAGDCVVMATYNKPLKANTAPWTAQYVFGYTATLEARKVSTAPIKLSETKWSVAMVYGNNNTLTYADQRTLFSLLNDTNTEALVFQPTCAASVFRVLQHEGTINPLVSVTGTPTSHETNFVHTYNTKGIVFVTYDGTSLRFYNGATLVKTVVVALSFRNGTIWLGTDVRQSNSGSEMKGWIGLVEVYDRTLSGTEIATRYADLNAAY